MKILFVVTDFDMGGITSSMGNLANLLIDNGNTVDILNLPQQKLPDGFNGRVNLVDLADREKFWNISTTDFKKAKGLKKAGIFILGLFKKFTNRSSLWHKIIFKKRKDRYDVAVAFRQSAACYYYVLKKVNANKTIGFIHGDVDYMNGAEKTFIKFMPKLHKIAYVSDAVKKGFIKKYSFLSANATTVYNVFDEDKIKALSSAPNPFNFDKFDKAVKNIVTVARIENTMKQIDWIPKICKILKEKTDVKFKWYIVGDGPDMEKDIQLAKELSVDDSVTFVGSTKNPFCIIKDAYFFVLPSLSESYGMVVIESLICGTPVVAASYPALCEVLEDGVYGVITSNSIKGIADAVSKLFNDENYYKRLRQNCLQYKFDAQNVYNQFLDAVK